MHSWIQRSKETLKKIIDHVKATNKGLTVEVAFVAYRDIGDVGRHVVADFTSNIDSVKSLIEKQSASGGGDFPEDVQGGYNQALKLSWGTESVKQVFHIADAPGHGKDICDWGDNYPKGSPDGFKIQDQMRTFAQRGIGFTFVKVNDSCNKMIKVMQDNYNPSGNTMNVTDLSDACATKSQAEVTKAFTTAVSFILSNAVVSAGDSKNGKKKKALVKKPPGKPLWNPKKFDSKQFFSQTAYLKVQSMDDVGITVKNSFGNEMFVSRDILQGMYSADHFKKELAMNMSGLAELL